MELEGEPEAPSEEPGPVLGSKDRVAAGFSEKNSGVVGPSGAPVLWSEPGLSLGGLEDVMWFPFPAGSSTLGWVVSTAGPPPDPPGSAGGAAGPTDAASVPFKAGWSVVRSGLSTAGPEDEASGPFKAGWSVASVAGLDDASRAPSDSDWSVVGGVITRSKDVTSVRFKADSSVVGSGLSSAGLEDAPSLPVMAD